MSSGYRTDCRICGSASLTPVLDLGHTPLADDFLTPDRLHEPETYYPLVVVQCEECDLVQLTYTVDRATLYSPDYPYLSSTTATGRAHYRRMAERIVDRFDTRGSLAVDIGSNVGVLLDGFRASGMTVLGVEPVPPIAVMANDAGLTTVNAFFSAKLAHDIVRSSGRARVITGTNVIAHIDDLHDLALGIRTLLAPDGVFVFEAPYLGDLLRLHAYDTIYHEHLSYLALTPVANLFHRYGLTVFDIEPQAIHGGTFRYFIAADGDYQTSKFVIDTLAAERDPSFQAAINGLAREVEDLRFEMHSLVHDITAHGGRVAAVSAPAKGMTLLNYCGLNTHAISFVTEAAPTKIGRYTPGTHIPVVSDSTLLELQPDYAILLAWNFATEIRANNAEYEARGGRFILPVPYPKVLDVGR